MSEDIKCCSHESLKDISDLQYIQHCFTCYGESEDDRGVCLKCVAACHDGHNLGSIKVATVSCRCVESGKHESLSLSDSKKRSREWDNKAQSPKDFLADHDDDITSQCSELSHHSYINYSNYEDDEDLVIFAPHKYDSDSDNEQKKPQKRCTSTQSLQKSTSDIPAAPSATTLNIRRAIALLESKNNANKAAAAAASAALSAAAAAESAAKKSSGKPPKKEKDPDAPRGAMASYMMFSNETRLVMREQTHGMTMVEVSRLIAARWKAMSPGDKQPYEELAREDRDRYLVEMHEYKLRKGL